MVDTQKIMDASGVKIVTKFRPQVAQAITQGFA